MADLWRSLVVAALAFAALAFLPLRLDAALAADALARRWRLRLRLRAAWGGPVWRLRLGSGPPGAAWAAGAGAGPGGEGGAGGHPDRLGRTARLRLARRIAGAVRVRRARLRLELGDADAAVTAVASGAAWALGAAFLAGLPGLSARASLLRVRSRYGLPRLAARAGLEARLSVWQAVRLALALRRR